MPSYYKVLNRISELLKTDEPEKHLKLLAAYQMETAPEMSKEEAMNCVIYDLIRTYHDYTLDYLWLEYMKANSHSDTEAA